MDDQQRRHMWRLLLNYADAEDGPHNPGLTDRQATNITRALESMQDVERMRMHQAFMLLMGHVCMEVANLLSHAPAMLEPDVELEQEKSEGEVPGQELDGDAEGDEEEGDGVGMVQTTLDRPGRPDAFGRQLEALVDALAAMDPREAGAHARALRTASPTRKNGAAWRRLWRPLRTTAPPQSTKASLLLWVEQWWATLRTWIRANQAPTHECVDAGVVADSPVDAQPKRCRLNEDSQMSTATMPAHKESEYRRQQEVPGTAGRVPSAVSGLALMTGLPAHSRGARRHQEGTEGRALPPGGAREVGRGPEGRVRDARLPRHVDDDSQENWEEEQLLHQQRVWEQVQNERAAARLQSWEDWVMHTEMHATPRRYAGTSP